MIKLVDNSLVIIFILGGCDRIVLNFICQLVVETCCQNGDFGILIQTVIICKTPNNLDVRIPSMSCCK